MRAVRPLDAEPPQRGTWQPRPGGPRPATAERLPATRPLDSSPRGWIASVRSLWRLGGRTLSTHLRSEDRGRTRNTSAPLDQDRDPALLDHGAQRERAATACLPLGLPRIHDAMDCGGEDAYPACSKEERNLSRRIGVLLQRDHGPNNT